MTQEAPKPQHQDKTEKHKSHCATWSSIPGLPCTCEVVGKPKSQPETKPSSVEALIDFNGRLVEDLFSSRAWQDIAFPLLQESIAGVSGRFTSNRYWHGTLTTNWKDENPLFVAGYQKALMDFYNHLHDFILAKDNQILAKKNEEASKSAPLYNPFMEEEDGA